MVPEEPESKRFWHLFTIFVVEIHSVSENAYVLYTHLVN